MGRTGSCCMGGPGAVFAISACGGIVLRPPLLHYLQLSADCQSTATSSLTRSATRYGRSVPATVAVITPINCAANMPGCCALDLCGGCNCVVIQRLELVMMNWSVGLWRGADIWICCLHIDQDMSSQAGAGRGRLRCETKAVVLHIRTNGHYTHSHPDSSNT